jgi:hypothetical protein
MSIFTLVNAAGAIEAGWPPPASTYVITGRSISIGETSSIASSLTGSHSTPPIRLTMVCGLLKLGGKS